MHDGMAIVEIRVRTLARNGILNIAGQAVPLLVGLVSVPIILHGLGTERFGLLVFSWTLTGSFSVFDLGLSGAVTKFVAEALGRNDERSIPGIIWPAAAGQTAFGAAGAGALILLIPALVTRFLNVSPALHAEAILAFRLAGAMLPVMLLTNSFRGALEAAQRFDVAASVKSASSASTFLIPLLGVAAGWDLPEIISGLLVVRALLLAVLFVACARILPILGHPVQVRPEGLRRLFGFGGWITVSALVGFAIIYGDRFVIGSALTMAAVSYYSVPLELISRLGLIAATLAAVLLPAFSTLGGAGDLSRLGLLFGRSIKYVIVTTFPAFALLAVFASEVLGVWLGPDAATHSGPVLRLLAIGAAFQVLAVVPASMVQGLGRPDLVAKFYLLQAPIYLGALWWLVRRTGIDGAALAWSGRFAMEGLLLLWVAVRMGLWSWATARALAGRIVAPVVGVCGLFTLIYALPVTMAQRIAIIAGLMLPFGWWVWTGALASEERRSMLDLASGWRRPPVPSAPPRQ